MAKKKNIVKYKRPVRLNLGILVFIIILAYFVISMMSYLFKTHVSIYEVQYGELASNMSYTGIAIREEKTVKADSDGYLNYYIKNGNRVGKGDAIFSVDESKTYYDEITKNASNVDSLDQSTLDDIASSVGEYVATFDNGSFYTVYDVKEQVNGTINEALNNVYLEKLKDSDSVDDSVFHVRKAKKPGVVTYWSDGYEKLSVDEFTPDLLNTHNYSKSTHITNDEVSSGEIVCKLVTSEIWQIIIPADEEIISELEDETNVKVYFFKDKSTVWSQFDIITKNDKKYLVLNFKNSMVRFVDDRYISLKLIIDKNSGLKIPNTAIINKEFYKIPKEYFFKGGDSGNTGLMVRDGETGEESFYDTTVYYKKAGCYYIDENDLPENFTIIKPDSTETYTANDTAKLKGVYNINKGYAVFKQIDITASNEEYTIVKSGTDYGLNLYDHIALDGESVEEGELVN